MVGVLSPTLTIEDLRLYNTGDFGGSLCLKMPELHVEYDPVQAREGKIRITVMRLNIEEIDVVQDKKGRVNFDAVSKPAAASGGHGSHDSQVKFLGIDTLNLSLGALRWTSLATGQQRVYQFGIKNQVFHGVKSEADLALLVALASASHTNFNLSDWFGAFLGR